MITQEQHKEIMLLYPEYPTYVSKVDYPCGSYDYTSALIVQSHDDRGVCTLIVNGMCQLVQLTASLYIGMRGRCRVKLSISYQMGYEYYLTTATTMPNLKFQLFIGFP